MALHTLIRKTFSSFNYVVGVKNFKDFAIKDLIIHQYTH